MSEKAEMRANWMTTVLHDYLGRRMETGILFKGLIDMMRLDALMVDSVWVRWTIRPLGKWMRSQ